MARIVINDQRRVAPGQAPGSFAAPDASQGADFASRQLQQVGQGIQQAGQLAGQIYAAEREKINETRVNDAINRAQREALDLRSEYTPLQGEAALRVGETEESVDQVYAPRFERRLGEIADELGLTAVQRARYQERAQPLALNFRAGVTNHFLAQNESYQAEVAASGIAVEQQTILGDPLNAEVTGASIARIEELVAADAARRGLSAEGTALAKQEFVGKAFLEAIIATEDEDLQGAQDIYDTHRDRMTATQQNAARNALGAGVATQNATSWVAARFAGTPAPPPGAPGGTYQHPVPGARRSSPHGNRVHPISGGVKMHDGVDYAAPAGSPVRAIAAGRVVRVGPNGGYGNFVEIDHGNGVVTGYAHLQDFDVAVGDELAAGQNLGRVGSTGDSTGPHLHLRARRDGRSIDPETLIGQNAEAAAAQAGAGRPTRAQLEREAAAEFGNNRIALAAARAEIARAYGLEEAEKREREEAARDTVFRHMEQTRTAPTAAMMAALPPGMVNTVNNYLEALIAPPTVRSDPNLLLALAANPEAVKEMLPEEIVANYGQRLTSSDLISLVGTSARAGVAAQQEAATAAHVPQQAFSSAWTLALDVAGIDRTPSGRRADSDRQALAQLNVAVREAIIERQRGLGRQLTREEISEEIQTRLGRLVWERPQGIFTPFAAGYQTSYETMTPRNQVDFRTRARERLGRNPTNDEIYAEYIRDRIRGR